MSYDSPLLIEAYEYLMVFQLFSPSYQTMAFIIAKPSIQPSQLELLFLQDVQYVAGNKIYSLAEAICWLPLQAVRSFARALKTCRAMVKSSVQSPKAILHKTKTTNSI